MLMENMKVRKIDLETFIDILMDIYNQGVDYVDIIGILGEEQDSVAVSFSKEYMSEEHSDNFDNINSDNDKNLSDEDLNQLI
jgi:hypothetical protein